MELLGLLQGKSNTFVIRQAGMFFVLIISHASPFPFPLPPRRLSPVTATSASDLIHYNAYKTKGSDGAIKQ